MPFHLKNLVLIAAFQLTGGFAFAQENIAEPQPVSPAVKTKSNEKVYEFVDEPADYPGGMKVLLKYISDNIIYPESAVKNGIQGKCYFQFIVADSGEIKQIKLKRGVPGCPECDKEALHVLEKMPKWIPGKVDGKNVNSYFSLPIVFKL